MPGDLEQLLKGMPDSGTTAPEGRRVYVDAKNVPPFIQSMRKMLEEQVRAIQAHPNTETATMAAVKRDVALGALQLLLRQVEDAMQRAEITGLITHFRVDKDG